MVTVYCKNPEFGQYLELAKFQFVDDAYKFVSMKRIDGQYPAGTVFIVEIPNE